MEAFLHLLQGDSVLVGIEADVTKEKDQEGDEGRYRQRSQGMRKQEIPRHEDLCQTEEHQHIEQGHG